MDDLVQETFFRAFRGIHGFRGGASFRTWGMAIGSNALKDARRREGRRPKLAAEVYDIADRSKDPHADVEGRDLERRFQECVQSLPAGALPPCREAAEEGHRHIVVHIESHVNQHDVMAAK